jgi:hypothetical protein
MSQENLELARRVLFGGVEVVRRVSDDASWSRYSDDVAPIIEPDCVFAWMRDGQRVKVTGLDECRQFWRDFFKSWESVMSETDRLIPLEGKVLALTRRRCRMAGSDNELEVITASIVSVRDGRVFSVEHYARRADALEAAGLRE